jgi:general L-amino acid transport system permease protein
MQDSNWLGFSVEAYLFVALIYFIFCNMISRMGRLFEKEFGV